MKKIPASDLFLQRPGQQVTIDGKQYIRIYSTTWKNASTQLIHVDLVMEAEAVKVGEGEFRNVKAYVTVTPE
jgi:hypothetical protein